MFVFYDPLIKWEKCPEQLLIFLKQYRKTLTELVNFIILFYAVSWNLALKFQHISDGPTVQHTIIRHAKRQLSSKQFALVEQTIEVNHYFLCPENIALILTSPDKQERIKLTTKLLSIAHGLGEDWKYNDQRIFKMTPCPF